ncbi:MAG: 4'-phosphopantetheinyl transferase superfamily protein [Gemmatimonadota bacterium]|nr:4'-phosphopantetheinyl transferase superfamily protein [Gemmatimonadota bacterium]
MSSTDLPAGEVQLWTVFHHVADARHSELERHLSRDETELRAKFVEERARKFTTTRATLRILISHYTGIAPSDVRFRYGPRGKPYLIEVGREGDPRIQFNLSDSADVVVFGFASDREIGVDIEKVRHLDRWQKISERFFGKDVAGELALLPAADRDREFIRRWVMEEARIKATGQGIWSRKTPEATRLCYQSFFPAPDYCGAVAAPGTDWNVRFSGSPPSPP